MGGLCVWYTPFKRIGEVKGGSTLAGCAETDNGCEGVEFPLEGVVPSCEQFSAQHSRAAVTCGVALWVIAAFLQQSISPIGHDSSLECRGIPIAALPATARSRIELTSHFLITKDHCRENIESLSTSSWATRVVTRCMMLSSS